MDILLQLVDFILHVDRHLESFVAQYGAWVYALLFLIIFVETGVVVMPFLPGDSLLFIVGAMCGAGLMSLPLAMGLLLAAAILGDQTNYTIQSAVTLGSGCSSGKSRGFSAAGALTKPTLFTKNTVASPSSWRASCLLCAPSCLSWRVWPR